MTLAPREIAQILREVVFQRRTLKRSDSHPSTTGLSAALIVDSEGWLITLHIEHAHLHHCEHCLAPDGRRWSLCGGDRFGTDPVALLSTWEHQSLEQLLTTL